MKTNEELEMLMEDIDDEYIYIKSVASYYWVNKRKLFKPRDVASNLMVTDGELRLLRKNGFIETFEDLCYSSQTLEGCYNLLDMETIIHRSFTAKIDDDIKTLIENVCGNKQENIDYLNKCILYKYHNLDDFTIPAIVFYGSGGSGKGTLVSLLTTIFGEINVLANLGQRDISGSFDTYKGQKLIVSFDEISSNNTRDDIRTLNRLKNVILAEKITINEKGEKQYQINNVAWFFISSNSNQPIKLDDKDKGNRRFTIIRSYKKLENGDQINKSVRDEEKVANYIAWLYETYPEMLEMTNIEALDNEDKRDLEDRSQNEANKFWDWLKENYPNIEKIFKGDLIEKMDTYFIDMNFDLDEIRDFKRYFWHYSKYTLKKIRIGDKTNQGVDLRGT